MIIKQKELQLVNTCGALYNAPLLVRAILWYSEKPVSRVKTVYLYGRYPAVSIYNKKVHIHRLVFMYINRCDLDSGEHIHHIDGNRLNAQGENLKLIGASDHMSLHNKGKSLSPEHRAKIGEANRRRKGKKMKKRVNIPRRELLKLIDQGLSINGIAKYYGCDWSTVKDRIDAL